MTARTPVLKLTGFAKQFQLHEQDKCIPSAENVELEVHAGELTALVGPTGAGKSSVLKGVYRTYLPSAGAILYRNAGGEQEDLARVDEHRILHLRRHEIGYVTQFLRALPRQPSQEVVAQPLLHRGLSRQSALELAQQAMHALALPRRLWALPPATFSGGERQRVNLARGFVARPRLLLLDEPTASLDPATSERVVEQLQWLKTQGVAMLAVFHDPELVTRLSDHTIELSLPSRSH